MSTNSIISNVPEWIEVSVSLPRDAKSFHDLNDLAKGLDDIDRLLRKLAPEAWLPYGRRVPRRAILQRFRIASRPEFDVLTNPAWLTLFVTVLVGYKAAKDSIREILSDASTFINHIDGLTREQVVVLNMGVRLMLERVLQAPEDGALKLAKTLHRTRSRLLGREEGRVTIIVREPSKKNKE